MNALELKENDLSLKYSEHPDKLRELMSSIRVDYISTGVRKFWPDDKDGRLVIDVRIERNGRAINFKFGMSINDTFYMTTPTAQWWPIKYGRKQLSKAAFLTARQEVKDGILYSLLACMRSEYYCPAYYPEFCAEFGYDEDSIKAKSMHEKCVEQSYKLQKIFKADEIEFLPS